MKRSYILAGALAGGALAVWYAGQRQPIMVEDKVVVITGASAGIGKATALAFGRAGARVVLVARRADVLEDARAELEAAGATSFAISADVTSAASCEALLAEVLDTCGRIDVLVNNAGIATGGPISELDEAELRTLVAVNVYGPIQLSRLVVPEMLKQGSGHIVNISSTAALLSPPGQTAYAASRAAILGFSDALRRELEGSGVYVSVIMPGWTKTGMLADMEPDKMRAAGMIGPGLGLDLPEVPAQAVVDAVRYRRREIILGGPLALLGWTATRGLIGVTDAYYRYLIDIHKMVEVMRDMGT